MRRIGKNRKLSSLIKSFNFKLSIFFIIVFQIFNFLIIKNALCTSLLDPLEIHFIDVWQGDAALIVTPKKNYILIDAGSEEGRKNLITTLKILKVPRINTIITTHYHHDHIAAIPDIVAQFPVLQVIDNQKEYEDKYFPKKEWLDAYLNYKRALKILAGRIELPERGQTLWFDSGVQLQILHPKQPASDNFHESCIVTRILYHDFAALFCADIEFATEKELIQTNQQLSSSVLKVSHHGADDATSADFMQAVKPQVGIISVGEGNPYGRPEQAVLDRIQQAQVEVFRTDQCGNIVIQTNGSEFQVMPKKGTLKSYKIKTNHE